MCGPQAMRGRFGVLPRTFQADVQRRTEFHHVAETAIPARKFLLETDASVASGAASREEQD